MHKVKIIEKTIKKTNKKRKVDVSKKDCEDMNNSRNRDAFSITKANGYLRSESEANGALEKNRSSNWNETEDTLIELIDLANKKA